MGLSDKKVREGRAEPCRGADQPGDPSLRRSGIAEYGERLVGPACQSKIREKASRLRKPRHRRRPRNERREGELAREAGL
jgi:hypothetical protein